MLTKINNIFVYIDKNGITLLLSLILFAAICIFRNDTIKSTYSISSTSDIRAGVQYSMLSKPITEAKANDVLYFFWYDCPHCKKIEINRLKENNQDLNFDIRHTTKQKFRNDALVFNAIKQTGHDPLLYNRSELTDEIKQSMVSKAVTNVILRDEKIRLQINAEGVPAMVIGGKYSINFSEYHYSNEELQTLIRYLANLS
jgi:hypothetical protein